MHVSLFSVDKISFDFTNVYAIEWVEPNQLLVHFTHGDSREYTLGDAGQEFYATVIQAWSNYKMAKEPL